MIKYLSIYKVQQRTARRIIPHWIQYGINDFLTIPEAKATLPFAEQMEEIYFNKEKEGPYTNNVEKIDPISIAKYAEKTNRKKVNLKNMHSTCIWAKSGIQSI